MKKFILLIFFTTLLFNAGATHNRAGEITYEWLGGLTYRATITTYTKESVQADRCELELFWGDSTSSILKRINHSPGAQGGTPCQNGNYGEPLGNDVKKNVYQGTHTYSAPGKYTLYFEDPNRNAGIANIVQSVQVVFYVHSELLISPSLGGNNSPILSNPPIDDGCLNQIYYHNTGAYDIDGDKLVYSLVAVRKDGGQIIPTIYDPAYVQDSLKIDPVTGDLIWDVPKNMGQFNFAIEIAEYRKKADGTYVRIGYVVRDLQIDILHCNNQPPKIDSVGPFCVEAGQNLTFNVTATDPDTTYKDANGRFINGPLDSAIVDSVYNGQVDTLFDGVTLRGFGGPFEAQPPATFTSGTANRTVTGTFSWNTNCSHVRAEPYFATFEAKDFPVNPNEKSLVSIYTVEIQVVAPAPQNPVATATHDAIELSWDPSVCVDASGYHIYRREDSYGFIPGECETGVPAYTGYTMVGETKAHADTFYVDSVGLERGKRYCYMVIAVFSDGAESYASEEFCASLELTLPLITRVDVETTDIANGEISVAWIQPPVIDSSIYPPPYGYKLLRSAGIDGQNFVEIQSFGSLTDTTFIDSNLNTEDSAYSYRIDFYYGLSQEFAGSSSPASSVFLEIKPLDMTNQLEFTHNTPWVNYQYIIYRDTVGDRANFHLLDTSNSNIYRDTGLVNGKNYCYYAMAYGRYTALDTTLPEPLINRSQINCSSPIDTTPPCPPEIKYTYTCESNMLTFEISNPDSADCRNDIVKYYIYYKPTSAGDFPDQPIDSITGSQSFYERIGQNTSPPIPGCYAITAIDDADEDPGVDNPNQSDYSNIICVPACPSINFPTYFTPNGDGQNDIFSLIPNSSRDIKEMRISIFNRWGVEVFSSTNLEEFRTSGWNGKDQNTGQDCVEGVYFYVAYYTPLSLDLIREEKFEGFVHLFR